MTIFLITRAMAAAVVALVSPTDARADPSVRSIVVDQLAYGRAPEGLHVGDVVEWINADFFRHTATATDCSFDIDLQPGAKGRTVLKRAGVVGYFCRFHTGMKGDLSVSP